MHIKLKFIFGGGGGGGGEGGGVQAEVMHGFLYMTSYTGGYKYRVLV